LWNELPAPIAIIQTVSLPDLDDTNWKQPFGAPGGHTTHQRSQVTRRQNLTILLLDSQTVIVQIIGNT